MANNVVLKQRNIEVDFIKVIALLFVFSVHFVEGKASGWLDIPLNNSPIRIASITLFLIFKSCVPLFFMASGYLLCERTCSFKEHYLKLDKIIIMYVVASTVCMIYKLNMGYQFRELVIGIFTFKTANYSWYVKYYVVLYMLMPFLNKLMNKMNIKEQLIFILFMLIIVSFGTYGRYAEITLNSNIKIYIFKILKNIFPALYYCMGACVCVNKERLLKKKYIKKWICLLVLFLSFVVVFMYVQYMNDAIYFPPNGYGIWYLAVISLLLFMLLYECGIYIKSKLKSSKFMVIISNSTLVIYLISYVSDSLWKTAVAKLQLPLSWYWLIICVVFTAMFSIPIGIIGTKVANRVSSLWRKLLRI